MKFAFRQLIKSPGFTVIALITLALIGTAIGLLLSCALTRVLTHTVAIVPGNDPWVIVVLAAVLVVVAVLACWLPAWRATKVDPMVALRAE